MSDTANELSGTADTAIQAGTTGNVTTGNQHVENGVAVQGDVHGGINLTFGNDEKK
jgi:hypothetical protein